MAALLALALTGNDAAADKYSRSKSPYWKVGAFDAELTYACRSNLFNQFKVDSLNIGYSGDKGKGMTGIATKAWNLRDLQGLARDGITYHFFNDGYSNCEVYTAKYR
ncbi:MAG: hypothetical protein HQ504_01145 [Rhodospirillaceae bacterium]|nr:hypothetical protein [Rhodospirillaceae bacterium]